MLNGIAPHWMGRAVLGRHQQRVEEGSIVLAMVDVAMVRLDVSAAQMLQAIDMMRMPVAQMLDFMVPVFDFPENLFLILAVLKKTYR